MKAFVLKPFIGAEDYETSQAFYSALGFTRNWQHPGLSEYQFGDCHFLLQNYYQPQWCENTMLHMTVDSAEAWFDQASGLLAKQAYGVAKVSAPTHEDYGALVTHVWDPSGVLWHFAEVQDT